MRQQGRLTDWSDGRGFGYITPLGGGPTVFAHISDFPSDERRPLLHDLVTYEIGEDDRGRTRAIGVQHLTPTRPVIDTSTRVPVAVLVAGLVVALAIVGATFVGWSRVSATRVASVPAPAVSTSGDNTIALAFQQQASGIQVTGEGVVTRVLADDNEGSRHQRFILRLASGQTLLVAHNIDIAPRLPSVAPGAVIAFSGEYAWNSQGGVIHWTHHDPGGQHQAGWLKHGGAVYQ